LPSYPTELETWLLNSLQAAAPQMKPDRMTQPVRLVKLLWEELFHQAVLADRFA
jgi:hypothetical protein